MAWRGMAVPLHTPPPRIWRHEGEGAMNEDPSRFPDCRATATSAQLVLHMHSARFLPRRARARARPVVDVRVGVCGEMRSPHPHPHPHPHHPYPYPSRYPIEARGPDRRAQVDPAPASFSSIHRSFIPSIILYSPVSNSSSSRSQCRGCVLGLVSLSTSFLHSKRTFSLTQSSSGLCAYLLPPPHHHPRLPSSILTFSRCVHIIYSRPARSACTVTVPSAALVPPSA
ncbi:hypothetical protein C8Q80DRAFT_739166 [Daedaleopsis nitida]|nr:hypothetical protein C8Q80DRAFT_739166 [Daedaleopsis nitida]